MSPYKPKFWNREFLWDLFGAAMVVAGIAGYFSADRWGAILLSDWLKP